MSATDVDAYFDDLGDKLTDITCFILKNERIRLNERFY